MAVDSSGNAVAVWQQSNGGLNNIWGNRYVAATNTWGTAQLIENDFDDASVPQVAVDSSGNAVAVWRQYGGSRSSIWTNRYVAATDSWGTAQLIIENNFGGVDGANVPQVAVDSDGNAVAVWTHWSTLVNIVANRYVAATNTWGTAQMLETDNAGHAYGPQVAVDGSGNVVAVWYQYDGTHYNIWASRYVAATNSWGTEQLIDSDNTSDALYPQVAVTGSGDAVVVWQRSDGTPDSIWANHYVAATNTLGTAQLIESNVSSALLPQVAVDGRGNAVAVWQQSDNRSPQNISNIWVNHYR